MANISNEVFFDETSTELTSGYLANVSNASAVTLQVDILEEGTAIALTFEGMNDLLYPEDYFPIKGVCLGDFKTYTTITKAGLYMFPIDGVRRCRMKATGNLTKFKAYAIAVG